MVERDSTAFEKLTPREREILRLIAGHLQSKEIARALGLSPKTVEMHVLSARRRLSGLSRRDAALAFVAWEGDPGNDYRKRPGGMATLTDTPLAGRKIGTPHASVLPADSESPSQSSSGRNWRHDLGGVQWLGLILAITAFTAAMLAIIVVSVDQLMMAIQHLKHY